MKIGDRISSWLTSNAPFREFLDWSHVANGRSEILRNYIRNNGVFSGIYAIPNFSMLVIAVVGYIIIGSGQPSDYFVGREDRGQIDNISKEVGAITRQAMTSPATREMIEVLGSLISDPVIGFLKSYGGKENVNIDEFLRGFYGTLMLPNVVGSGINTLGEVLSGGQIDTLGSVVKDSYFTLGLGFIGWQGISPLLTESVLPAVTRDAKRTYRQARFKTADLMELYSRRKIEVNELVAGLRDEGWRDSDHDKVMFLALNNLTRSDIMELYELGKNTREQTRELLWKAGYTDYAALRIIEIHDAKKTEEPKSLSLASAKKAFKLGIITVQQFRTYLEELGYNEATIQLEISIITFDKEVEEKELSLSQLRTAYLQNIITVTEITLALKEQNYSSSAIATIIKTWQAQKAPKVLRINKGTIIQALTKGVISSDVAYKKLRELTYSDIDAKMIIEIATVQTGVNTKKVSDAKLLQAYQSKIISSSELGSRLKQRGYDDGDIALLVRLTDTQNKIDLKQDDILDAYLFGAIDRNKTVEMLQALGATQSFIDTRLATMDKRRESTKVKPSASDVSTWLRGELIDESKARLKLQEIGYTSEDSGLFIEAVSIAPGRTLSDSNIVDAVTSGVIGTDKALELFMGIGLSRDDAQLRIDTIIKQREIFKPRANASTLVSATRDGIIDATELEGKLRELGLDDESIQLYVQMATFENPAKDIMLSKSDILKAYRKGFLIEAESMALLEGKGYSLEEASLLLAMEERDITITEVYGLLNDGLITPDEAIAQWSSMGYDMSEIESALESLGFEE